MFGKLAIALAATTIVFGVASTPTDALARGFGGGAHFGGGGARFGGGVARFGGLRSFGPVARGYGGYYGGRRYYYGGRRFAYGALGLLGAGLAYNYTSCYVWTPYGYVNECGYGYGYGWY